ncbi:MAG: polysaccharide deacetylase family protein [Candidatus Omnitrophica bacterium]|nr:polysaccharide deacetylase family protein [Candidatus Omnitrophota bacterium]
MKGLLRDILSEVAYGAIRLVGGGGGIRVLTYHRVTDAHPEDRLCVPVKRFAEQMQFLHEAGYRGLTMSQVTKWIRGGNGVSGRRVAITFDDGFEDNYLYAFPELKRWGFTACFFVPTEFIQSGQAGRPEADRPMTWEQMRRMLDAGQEIGGHSVTHRKLTKIPASEWDWEIRGCKEILEEGLERPVDYFCYPAGYYNDEIRQLVEKTGYAGAFTVKPGAVKQGMDPFAISRTEVSAFDSLRDFEKKLAGAYDWMHAAVQRVNHT